MIIKFNVNELNVSDKHTVYNALILGSRYKHIKEKSSTVSAIATKMITINTDTKELTTDDHYVLNTVKKELFIRVKRK